LGKDNPTEFAFYYVLAPRPALRVEGLPALSWPFGFEVPGNAFRDSDEVKEGIRRRLWLQNNRAPLREFVANIDDCPVCPAAGLNELDWNGFGISSKAPRFLTRFLRKAETPGAYSSWVWVAETKEASPLIPTFHAIEFFKGRMKCAYGKTYSATLKRRKQQMKLNLQRSTALTEAEINVLVDPDGGADSGPEGR
jgi:hypothetical protein